MVKIVGQQKIKDSLAIIIGASHKTRNGIFKPILLTGPAGYGKTTIARHIAEINNQDFLQLNGVAVTDMTEFAKTIYKTSESNTLLFIDEIHSLSKDCQELMYTVIEDSTLTNPQRAISVPIKPFNIVGATTDEGKLLPPMYSRFVYKLRLEEYSKEELEEIITDRFPNLDVVKEDIVKACRGCPRTLISLATWVNDYYVSKDGIILTSQMVKYALKLMSLNSHGYTLKDLEYLLILYNYNNKPVGLKTIMSHLNDSRYNIENVIEPFLLRNFMMKKTAAGRMLTDKSLKLLQKLC